MPPAHVQPVELILNGTELHHGVSGVNVYLQLLTEALRTPPETLNWRLAVPRPCVEHAKFVPEDRLLVVEGRNMRGYDAWNLYWNHRIAGYVRRHHPSAVFHSVFHFWTPLPPRKLVTTIHDCIELIEPSVRSKSPKSRVHRWLCRAMARRAAAVIVISEWTRAQAVRHYGVRREKTALLYNWVRPSCQQRTPPESIAHMRERYKLPEKYIAYVGGYRAYKNVEFLIKAWSLAQRQQPLPPLVLAGSIPDGTNNGFFCDVRGAAAAANLSADDFITPGLISDEDLPAFYAGASLFVSPSRQEGFGYPAVEATACGTPVLVSDASVYPEIFPDRSQRFSLEDHGDLSERLQIAMTQPARFRAPLEERFTAAYGKCEYERIIRSVLA